MNLWRGNLDPTELVLILLQIDNNIGKTISENKTKLLFLYSWAIYSSQIAISKTKQTAFLTDDMFIPCF